MKLTECKVIIIPVVNPDGFIRNSRFNANGVDLNRNFPPTGSASQPETQALMNLMENYKPIFLIQRFFPKKNSSTTYNIIKYLSYCKTIASGFN